MRVTIRGTTYQSVPEAAAALGVAPATIYSAVTRGRTDSIGLGKGNRTPRRGGRPPKPVKIGSVLFPSMAEASRALGFERRYVQRVMTAGKTAARQSLIRAAMTYVAQLEQNAIARQARADREFPTTGRTRT